MEAERGGDGITAVGRVFHLDERPSERERLAWELMTRLVELPIDKHGLTSTAVYAFRFADAFLAERERQRAGGAQ